MKKFYMLLIIASCSLCANAQGTGTHGEGVYARSQADIALDHKPAFGQFNTSSDNGTVKADMGGEQRELSAITEDQIFGNCTASAICPQLTTNSGSVRGYYFIAPISFTICGLFIPTDAAITAQSIEVLRFRDSLPPAYPKITNNFVSLFYTASDTSSTMIPCNILVNSGDTIGVYGSRGTGTVCSYAMPQCTTSIAGNTVTLYRSGMQFPLYNQQMHDVWSEIASDISRVIMYTDVSLSVPETAMDPSLISVYPNPTSGVVALQIADRRFRSGHIDIYNVYGEKVYSTNINNLSSTIHLDAPAGIYFLHLKTGEGTAVKKIVISK